MKKSWFFIVFGILLMMSKWCPAALAAPVQWNENGHYYDLISAYVNWDEAKVAAESTSFMGYKGHLATITSGEENLFITNAFGPDMDRNFLQHHWIGAFQQPGSAEPSGGWTWVTGEQWNFSNWYVTEPSNGNGNENVIEYDRGFSSYGKEWNDLSNATRLYGYVVEYDVPKSVPIPPSILLLGFGLMGLERVRRKFKN